MSGFAFAAMAAAPSAVNAQVAKPRIRIGQIGTAHAHAAGKMETMRKLDDFEVVGVVESDGRRRAALAASKIYGGIPVMTEEQLLAAPGLQAVAVETEVKSLVPAAARCIAAGKHVHLDKPAGESLPAFRRLLDDATARKLTVQMGYMLRYNPAFIIARQLVREGALGEVFSIEAAMGKLQGDAERHALAAYRGGAMFELGCHVIDSVVAILGRPEKVTPYSRSSSPLRDGFPDNQTAVLEYPNAIVTVRSVLVEWDGGARRQFTVCGTKGTTDIRPIEHPEARLTLEKAHGEYKAGKQLLTFPKGRGRYDGDFEDLAKVIRGEKALEFTPAHDLAVQETILLASGLPLSP
ncbi:MAG: Gfo/Idh/MocA family oxidoreductase [Chthoniobacteraceae bacterium]